MASAVPAAPTARAPSPPAPPEDAASADTRPLGVDEGPTPYALLQNLGEQVRGLQQALLALQRDNVQTLRQLALSHERERTAQRLAEASRATPKEARVVFVGRRIFGCNLKYAWLATQRRAAALGFECWYLPQDEAQEALMATLGVRHFPHHPLHWSAEHVRVALRTALIVAGEAFVPQTQTNPQAHALFAGARQLQLWHGEPLKEVGLQHPPALAHLGVQAAETLCAATRLAGWAGAAAASEAQWRRGFDFERYAVTGHARNDVLLREPQELDLLNVDRDSLAQARSARAAGRRVLLYAPTYRDQLRGQWLLNIGLEQLAEACAARGDLLLVTLHPHEQGMAAQLRPRYPALRLVAAGTDVHPLLRETDALISDWSSLIHDYLLLDRPILLWRHDAARFAAPKRRLNPLAQQHLAGPAVASVEDLIRLLQGDLAGLAAAHAPARAALRARLFDHGDAGSAERVADWVVQELRRALPGDEATPPPAVSKPAVTPSGIAAAAAPVAAAA